MPRGGEERLAEYARTWRERGIRAWGEGWWNAGDRRRPGRPHHRRAARLDRDAPERRDRRGGRPVVLPPVDRSGTASSTSAATSPPCATSTRRSPTSTSSSARTTTRSSTRSTSGRCSCRSATSSSSPARSRTSSDLRRAHEVGAHVVLDAYQSAGIVPLDVTALGRRLRRRRLRQVALRRARATAGSTSVPTSPSGSSRTLTGWQAHASAVRLRGGDATTRRAPRGSSPARRTSPRTTRRRAGYDLIEEIGVDRIRENSLRQTELLIDLAETAGFEVRSPREPARRGGTVTIHVPDFPAVHGS